MAEKVSYLLKFSSKNTEETLLHVTKQLEVHEFTVDTHLAQNERVAVVSASPSLLARTVWPSSDIIRPNLLMSELCVLIRLRGLD